MVQQICNSAQTYWKMRLCLDQVRLNEALIRAVHRGPTVSDILPRLARIRFLTLIHTYSGYPSLKLNKK